MVEANINLGLFYFFLFSLPIIPCLFKGNFICYFIKCLPGILGLSHNFTPSTFIFIAWVTSSYLQVLPHHYSQSFKIISGYVEQHRPLYMSLWGLANKPPSALKMIINSTPCFLLCSHHFVSTMLRRALPVLLKVDSLRENRRNNFDKFFSVLVWSESTSDQNNFCNSVAVLMSINRGKWKCKIIAMMT